MIERDPHEVYVEVRDALRRLPSTSLQGVSSARCRTVLQNLEYLWDAPSSVIHALLRHAAWIHGISIHRYREGDDVLRKQLQERLQRLQTIGDPALLVPEPDILGSHGLELQGGRHNEDTLTHFEALIGLDRGRILDRIFRPVGQRPLVWLVGGGWGSFAHALRSLFPDATYLISDLPERFLMSAVYLRVAFPDATSIIVSDSGKEEHEDWARHDFVFLPADRAALIESLQPDIAIRVETSESLGRASLRQQIRVAARAGCPLFFSFHSKSSGRDGQERDVDRELSKSYTCTELPLPGPAHVAAFKGKPVSEDDLLMLRSTRGQEREHVVAHLDDPARARQRPAAAARWEGPPTIQEAAGIQPSKVALGMTVYNGAAHLECALRSILRQTFRHFVLVVIDDGSTDDSAAIVHKYAKADRRISFIRNDRRTGMIAAWRRAFKAAYTSSGKAEFFAWVSDHDIWHTRWLETMVAQLESDPQLALVYPLPQFVDERGELTFRKAPLFSNHGLKAPAARFRYTISNLHGAGNMVYGLFRSRTLIQAGIFREVLLPDRLLMLELSLHGRIKQVLSSYWYRRRLRESSPEVQRATLFGPGRLPLSARLPWPVVFVWTLAREYLLNRTDKSPLDRDLGRIRFASLLLQLLRAEFRVAGRTAP